MTEPMPSYPSPLDSHTFSHLPSSATQRSAAQSWQPPSPEELQAMLPQYEIAELLGHGGMGAVYKGRQSSLDRYVAIKILPPQLQEDENNFVERFKQEARAMAKLSHPGIVAVYDFGTTAEGILYFVMEYVEGTDVQRMITDHGRLHSAEAHAITAHVCDALQYAHDRGIIHRDIKPSNIMMGSDGVVKVADFGLAKMSSAGEGLGLTRSSAVLGTMHYLAPEALILGVSVDHRADVYAMGVMLYQMLTGKVPHGMFELPSRQVPGLDPRFDEIVSKAMREDRDQRYSSAADLRADLDAMTTRPISRAETDAAPAPDVVPPEPAATVIPSTPRDFSARRPAPANEAGSRRGLFWSVAIVVVLLVAAAGFQQFQKTPRPSAPSVVTDSLQSVPSAVAVAPQPVQDPPQRGTGPSVQAKASSSLPPGVASMTPPATLPPVSPATGDLAKAPGLPTATAPAPPPAIPATPPAPMTAAEAPAPAAPETIDLAKDYDWTNKEGVAIKAKFISLANDNVTIRTATGTFTVPLPSLSPASVVLARKLADTAATSHSLMNFRFVPSSPGLLPPGEKLSVGFDYFTVSQVPVYIHGFGRKGGREIMGRISQSPPHAPGSGKASVWFISDKLGAEIDQFRIVMSNQPRTGNGDLGQVLSEVILPVNFKYEGSIAWRSTVLKSYNPAQSIDVSRFAMKAGEGGVNKWFLPGPKLISPLQEYEVECELEATALDDSTAIKISLPYFYLGFVDVVFTAMGEPPLPPGAVRGVTSSIALQRAPVGKREIYKVRAVRRSSFSAEVQIGESKPQRTRLSIPDIRPSEEKAESIRIWGIDGRLQIHRYEVRVYHGESEPVRLR